MALLGKCPPVAARATAIARAVLAFRAARPSRKTDSQPDGEHNLWAVHSARHYLPFSHRPTVSRWGACPRSLSLSTTSSQSTTDATVYLCTFFFFFFIVFVFFQSRLVYLQQCVQQKHQQHSDNELSAICARALIRFCSSVFAAVSYSTHFKADFCYSAEKNCWRRHREVAAPSETSSLSGSRRWSDHH